MQTASDEREASIITAARRGDTKAFAHLVERYQTPVYNLAYRLLGDAAEAEDAAQETFLRSFTQLARYDRRQAFGGWLTSIATHYCIDRLRRRKYAGPSLDDDAQAEFAADDPLPEEITLAHERADEAQKLLSVLPPGYRIVVVLKYWNALSVADIARTTGDSEANVKVRLHRARQMMARAAQRRPAAVAGTPEGDDTHAC